MFTELFDIELNEISGGGTCTCMTRSGEVIPMQHDESELPDEEEACGKHCCFQHSYQKYSFNGQITLCSTLKLYEDFQKIFPCFPWNHFRPKHETGP